MMVRFYTRETAKNPMIYVRAKHRKAFDLSTSSGIVVRRGDFSNKHQEIKDIADIKNRHAINAKLEELRTFLIYSYNDTAMNDNNFNSTWLKDRVNKFFNRV